MTKPARNRLPIRVRLTLWYVLLMAVTFTAFAFYLLARFQGSLQADVDASLEITVSKTIAAFDQEDYLESGRLTFDHIGTTQPEPSDFAMRLISVEGEVWDTYGVLQTGPVWGIPVAGFSTPTGAGEASAWRILSQPLLDPDGQTVGWLQAARSLQTLSDTLEDLNNQLLLGIPLLLLFAGFGGYFLADRALRPMDRITEAAQEITAHDLSRRLDYRGATDEVGRLAQTFDQMLERLQSSFERERRFTEDAAHELRTPLTVLKGQIEVTLGRPRLPGEYEAKLRELAAQVDRLIRLSNALLFLARAGQNQISFEPVNLREMLEALVEQIQPFADEKGLKIEMDIPTELTVFGDGDQLARLFMNLLENVWKYTPAGGQAHVTATQTADESRVTIHNSGAGISAEHLPHLFERFYRIDEDRSSQSGGTGLGLSIANEIAQMHGGEISVWSEAGKGVTLTVRLPVEKR